MKPFVFFSFLLFSAAASAQELSVSKSLEDALAQAKARRQPVVVEFHAPWCYSCYYMSRNVLTGPEWTEAKSRAVHVEFDADQRDGSHWMQAWNVKALPSYIVLGEDGKELGRILGEQTRDAFYGRLYTLMGLQGSLQALQSQVTAATPQAVAAAREFLRSSHARGEAREALAWIGTLPAPILTAVSRDKDSTLWIARLEALRAAQSRDNPACLKAEGAVLTGNTIGCERPYELSRYLACASDLAPEPRRALLREQAQRMQALLDQQVFAESATRCADERSIVIGTAGLYEEIGDAPGQLLTFVRAASNARERLKDDPRTDRNLADNLRVYLERAGKTDELGIWLGQLVVTYPDDYVYAYRYARFLAAKGEHAQALQLYERAAAKSYGVNKLKVAQGQAETLIALDRAAEARALIEATLQANGPWFPEEGAKLRALMPPA
ncbi:MAG: thioredoxin family protein [Pseudomonadota bacterium]